VGGTRTASPASVGTRVMLGAATRLASIIAIAFGLQPLPAQEQQQAGVVPFGVGERLVYDVRFGPKKVGTGSMEVSKIDTVRNRDTWLFDFRLKGRLLFYSVNDVFQSWVDTTNFHSLRFIKDLDELGNDRERHYEIYPERGMFAELKRNREAPTVEHPLDEASFLYFIRTVPLEIGQTYEFHRYFIPDRNPVRIKVLRRERVTVPAGTFQAIVIQPLIKTSKIFSENGSAELWLTEDPTRIMVQMKSNLPFGSLNLYLRSIRPPTITIEPPIRPPGQ
jgi:hypothetical protein